MGDLQERNNTLYWGSGIYCEGGRVATLACSEKVGERSGGASVVCGKVKGSGESAREEEEELGERLCCRDAGRASVAGCKSGLTSVRRPVS